MKRVSTIMIMSSLFLLAACGGGEEETNLPPIVVATPVEMVSAGTCDDTSALEDWLETTEFQIIALNGILNEASGKTRAALRDDAYYLAESRNYLALSPAPDCTINAQAEVIAAFDETVTALTNHVNGAEGDIDAIVRQARAQLDLLRPDLDALIAQMEAQFQSEQ